MEVRDGEVWARSPYLCTGYGGPPGPLRRAGDGWATVGDRGRLEDGRLQVAGRADAVTVAGRTVEPAVVEALLRPAARGDVVVVGVARAGPGHVLAGVLSAADDWPAVRTLARAELEGAHRPRLWFHLEELPTTPAGKVDRDALVRLLQGPTGRPRRLV